jgi:hypothetical protein
MAIIRVKRWMSGEYGGLRWVDHLAVYVFGIPVYYSTRAKER